MGHAIFEQRSGILGVAVASACGVLSSDQLIQMGEIAKKIQVHGIKMTSRSTIVFLINSEDLKEFRNLIEKTGLSLGVFGSVVRNVKGCAGSDALCMRALGDAYSLGVEIQKKFMNQPVPKDFKISTAGCIRACTDPYCADFGVIAIAKDTFSIYIGGRGGSRQPVHGKLILERVSSRGVMEVLDYVLKKYREIGKKGERLCRTIERCGIDNFIPDTDNIAMSSEDALKDFLDFMK